MGVWKVAGWAGHSVEVLQKHYASHIHTVEDVKLSELTVVETSS